MKTKEIHQTTANTKTLAEVRREELEAMIHRAGNGDREAIGWLAIDLRPRLVSEAKRVLGDHKREAEDVVQDLFVFLLETDLPLHPVGGATEWLFFVLRFQAKRRKQELEREEGCWNEDENP